MKSTYNSKVLIVDDMKINRQLLASVLADYVVIEAGSGEEALALVAEAKPDIVLLDIKMPGTDGIEVCQILKSSPNTVDIPIIFITGNDEPGQARKCFEVGAVDFLAKPFDLNEVNARVHTHLSLKMARESLVEQNKLLEEKVLEQQLNIQLASQVLSLINPHPTNMINLGSKDYLYTKVLGRSCKQEGGDHYMIKELHNKKGGNKTLVSIKDQSGHAVNCILRCIITDLLHNSSIYTAPESSLVQKVSLLNNAICTSSLFKEDDFFTALFLEFDHESRRLQYVSAGHPPFLLIRDGVVTRLPSPGESGTNLPMAFQEGVVYSAGETILQPGDKLLMYTDGLTDMTLAGPDSKSISADELVSMITNIVKRNQKTTVSFLMAEILLEISRLSGLADGNIDTVELVDDVTLLGMEFESLNSDCQQQSFTPNEFNNIDAMIDHIVITTQKKATECGAAIDGYRLRMALSEGVLNAFKHGNLKDVAMPITIGWHFSNGMLVTIKDAGKGVDFNSVCNPTRFENRTKESGRGIFCMRKSADYVGWQDEESTLLLAFPINHHPWTTTRCGVEEAIDLWQDPLPGF